MFSVVFAGFSAEALRDRITDSMFASAGVACSDINRLVTGYVGQAETVMTADEGVRGGKIIELKKTVDEAVGPLSFVKQVFVMSRTGADVPMSDKDISLEEVCLLQRGVPAAEGCVCCRGVCLL